MVRVIVPLPDGRTGWFDRDAAEAFAESTTWNGEDRIGVVSGIPHRFGGETLYRTRGDKWVRNRDATHFHNGLDEYEFLTDEQAREWLIKTGQDEVVERFFGELEEERGPGRPKIGPMTSLRLPADLTERIDAARTDNESRADAIRRLLEKALA